MQSDEIAAGTSLVHLLKDGTPRVTKEALVEQYGKSKRLAARVTRDRPQTGHERSARPSRRRRGFP
jgi:hypothetical protein